MNLILCTPDDFIDDEIHLSGRVAHHVRSVLQKGVGDELNIGILGGSRGQATIRSITDSELVVDQYTPEETPARSHLSLLLAAPRPKVMNRLWMHITTIGLDRILITNASKVERYYFDSSAYDPDMFHARILEGLEQANDTCLPRVSIHLQFKHMMADIIPVEFKEHFKVALHPDSENRLPETIRKNANQPILLAIGPEGGWNEYELERLREAGFFIANMGRRILRSDTACIAALSTTQILTRP